jgi:hypothetical protein
MQYHMTFWVTHLLHSNGRVRLETAFETGHASRQKRLQTENRHDTARGRSSVCWRNEWQLNRTNDEGLADIGEIGKARVLDLRVTRPGECAPRMA